MLTCVDASVLVLKIMLGVQLLTYAARRRAGMEAREEADKVNDFGRDPIGEGKEEQVGATPYLCACSSHTPDTEVQQGSQDASRQQA